MEFIRKVIAQYPKLSLLAWASILFIPFLGAVHLFDWDEINFAESAREMLVTGNFQKVQINYKPFMEKPPLFFWFQALSMQLFGVTEFASRIPNALVGIATLFLVFSIGKKWFNTRFAWLWVIMVTGSITPHLYFKTGIIDPLYNLFIICSVYQLFLYSESKNGKHAWFLGAFLGLAIITKGPVAVIIVVLCFLVYWLSQRFRMFFDYLHLFYAVLAAFLVSAVWFGVETLQSGPTFLVEFIKYQIDLFLNPVAGHGQPFWYHPLVLLLGCFPASIIAMPILFKRSFDTESNAAINLYRFMHSTFWVVLILFSIVETKIVHYSSLCYLPITFIAAFYLYKLELKQFEWKKYQTYLFVIIGAILSFLLILITFVDVWKPYAIPYIKDDFAVASLSVSGGWQSWEFLLGSALLIMVLFTIYKINLGQKQDSLQKFLLFNSILIPCLLAVIAPRVEQYSQAPAIEFFETLQDKDVYIESLGYKSYAPYFYGRTKPPTHDKAQELEWLLNGDIDKDAYFSLHVNNVDGHINPKLKKIGEKGGFVFYKRSVMADSLETMSPSDRK